MYLDQIREFIVKCNSYENHLEKDANLITTTNNNHNEYENNSLIINNAENKKKN